jgi:hypothetical protein
MLTNWLGIALLAASLAQELSPAQVEAVKSAYRKLGNAAVMARPSSPLPASARVKRIDVSEKIRSASFGHRTTLLVPFPAEGEDPHRFWVELGPSTNHREPQWFGPFFVGDPPGANSSQPR